jgi:hypothetical protein
MPACPMAISEGALPDVDDLHPQGVGNLAIGQDLGGRAIAF